MARSVNVNENKECCSFHNEIQHDLYGDGLNKRGLIAEFYEFKALVLRWGYMFAGGSLVVGVVWAIIQTIGINSIIKAVLNN